MFEIKKLMRNRTKYIDKFNKLFIKFIKGTNIIISMIIFEKLDKMWEAIKFSYACIVNDNKAETMYHEVFGGGSRIIDVSENRILAAYNFLATVLCENPQFTFKQIALSL